MAEDNSPMAKANDSRFWAQCALMDNMHQISKKIGSPEPGYVTGETGFVDIDGQAPSRGVKAKTGSLMNPIARIHKDNKEIVEASIPKNVILFQDRPEVTISKLNNSSYASSLFEATPAQLSQLVPKIGIWVSKNNAWKKINFSSHFHADYFDERKKLVLSSGDHTKQDKIADVLRGVGDKSEAGIKKFTFEFDNNMFYERNMKASLVLYFQSLHDLATSEYASLFKLSEISGIQSPITGEEKQALSDARVEEMARLLRYWGLVGVTQKDSQDNRLSFNLADRSGSKAGERAGVQHRSWGKGVSAERTQQGHLEATPLFTSSDIASSPASVRYKYLKATVGWSDPSLGSSAGNLGESFSKAVRYGQRTLLLNMTEYDISFKEQGQVEVTLNYVAALDTDNRQGEQANILENLFQQKEGINPLYEYQELQASDFSIEKFYSALDPATRHGRKFKEKDIDLNGGEKISKIHHESSRPSIEFLQGQRLANQETVRRMEGGYGVAMQGIGAGYIQTRMSLQYGSKGNSTFLVQEGGVVNEIKLIEAEQLLLERALGRSGSSKYTTGHSSKAVQDAVRALSKDRKRLGEMLTAARAVRSAIKKVRRAKQTSGLLQSLLTRKTAHTMLMSYTAAGASAGGEGSYSDKSDIRERKSNLSVDLKKDLYKISIITHQESQANPNSKIGGDYESGRVAAERRQRVMISTYGTKSQKKGLTEATTVTLDTGYTQQYATTFVKFGDIVSMILDATPSWSTRPDYELIMGTYEVEDFFTGTKMVYNIADVPIPSEVLNQWFFDRVLDTDRRTYPLRSALRDLTSDVLTPAIDQQCQTSATHNKNNVSFSLITVKASNDVPHSRGKSDHAPSPIDGLYYGHDPQITDLPDNSAFTDDISSMKGLISYYVMHSTPLVMRGGDPVQDAKYGIYHLILGQDRGLVKRIDFKRKEMPYLEAMNIENANSEGVLAIPMDATVEMVGNNFFRHGQIVYINAEMGLGRSVADTLKVGGYYMVTKVSNSLDSSGWQTTLSCIWLSERAGNTSKSERGR